MIQTHWTSSNPILFPLTSLKNTDSNAKLPWDWESVSDNIEQVRLNNKPGKLQFSDPHQTISKDVSSSSFGS